MSPDKHLKNFHKKETKIDISSSLIETHDLPFISSAIEDYHIVRQIGSGATGIVYEAFHKQLKRRVAIKILKTHLCKNKVVLERFSREGETIARLKHENIATIYDFVSKGDMHYIVMEFIEGSELEGIMKKVKKIPFEESVNIIMGVLRGLNMAHESNIIHRDIKPSNIIISSKGAPILFDFGLAKLKNEAKNISNVPIGTPSYMAPEQFQDQMKHKISHKTDFFSLGVMFYEMLTGELPFQGDSFSSIMNKIITQDPLPPSKINPSIPKKLDKIILKLLEKDSEDRYRSAKEILEDLECFKKNLPLKYIKNWPLNTLKKFLYRFILRNTYVITAFALILSFFLAYSIFRYVDRLAERTIWINVYSLNTDFFLDSEWKFYEGFHEMSPLSNIQKRQTMIPLDKESLILNTSSSIYGVYETMSASDVKMECSFQQVIRLDPGQPSRTGIFICSQRERLSGYIFTISGGNAYFSKNFIENTILEKPVPPEVYIEEYVHVVMEKRGSEINVVLNGKPFFSYQDFMPLSSPEYGFSGFIAENVRMKVRRISLFSLGMPQKTSPVIIAQKLMELGEYEKAMEVYKEIIRDIQDKDTVINARYQMGIIESKLGHDQEALKHFHYIIEYTSHPVLQSKSYYQKAMIYLKNHKIDFAKDNFLKAKNIYPSYASHLNILAGIFDYLNTNPVESLEEARFHEDILKFMFQNFPDFKASFIHEPKEIALYYFSHKEYNSARGVFQRIMDEFPFKKDYCAWAQLMVGESYRQEGYLDLAMRAYNEVSEIFPDQKWIVAWALHRKAYILAEQGRNEDAVKIFQEIISRYKEDVMEKQHDDFEGSYDDIVYNSYLEIQKLKNKY